jgi:putative RNA 2'-phosphotransferase
MTRLFVHLSPDVASATAIGSKHGAAIVVFKVHAQRMHADKASFFIDVTGLWLLDVVPPRYLGAAR